MKPKRESPAAEIRTQEYEWWLEGVEQAEYERELQWMEFDGTFD